MPHLHNASSTWSYFLAKDIVKMNELSRAVCVFEVFAGRNRTYDERLRALELGIWNIIGLQLIIWTRRGFH